VAWLQATASQVRRQLTGLAGGPIHSLGGSGECLSLITRGEGGQRWHLADSQGVAVRHLVQLPRCGYHVRVCDEVAVYCDEHGRLLAVDLAYGRLLRDFRVR
jgi:hypothetical protein